MSINKTKYSFILSWILQPAALALGATLAMGAGIRAAWAFPLQIGFETPTWVHAHSHLAIMGWLFPALAGLMVMRAPLGRFPLPGRFLMGAFWALVVVMTAAFAREGYAPLSILTSTLLTGFMGAFGYLWLVHERRSDPAVWLMLLSLIGPLALGGGAVYGPAWIRGWVTFYLHLHLNGWVVLAALGLERKASERVHPSLWVMAGATLLLLEPHYRVPGTAWVGMMGGLLQAVGAAWFMAWRVRRGPVDTWLGVALAALAGKSALQWAGSWPGGPEWMLVHDWRIGFTHLILLLLATPLVLRGYVRRVDGAAVWALSGSAFMVALLFLQGALRYAAWPEPFPLAPILFLTGMVATLGLATTLIRQHRPTS